MGLAAHNVRRRREKAEQIEPPKQPEAEEPRPPRKAKSTQPEA